MAAYCAALEREIALAAETYGAQPVDTVYLGGGTPSVVPPALMRGVLRTLRGYFSIRPGTEFTAEANPGTLTGECLDVLREAGGNRLSLGVQAKQERLLRTLGRIHTFAEAEEAVALARSRGFANLNADAMFGLPGQTSEDYSDTLDALAGLGVTHISAYSLIIEEGTPLSGSVARGELVPPGEDDTADMMERGIDRLESLGYRRYEISNFAKPGFECAHNLGCWRREPYLGLGLNAASLLPAPKGAPESTDSLRRVNTALMTEYLNGIARGKLPVAETTPVSRKEAMFEAVMLGLRTVEGVGYAEFAQRYGNPLPAAYPKAIETLTAQGLLRPAEGPRPRLALTRRGMALQNTALMAFMEA